MKKKIVIKSLSIVIPLYNEILRIPHTLKIIKKFLQKNKLYTEIIFVNDGSTDKSKIKIENFLSKIRNKKTKCKLISYKKNMGKGYAIIQGIKKSSYPWILTCDFDMSVLPSTVMDWFNKNFISEKKCAYLGSRKMKASKIKTLKIREFYGMFFNILIYILFNIKIKDTQCGFKLYHSSYIKKILPKLKSFRYVHDIEIINSLINKNINIKELPLKWVHKSGSKINLLRDPIKMILDLIMIKIKAK